MSNHGLTRAAGILRDAKLDASAGEVRGSFEGVQVTVRMVVRGVGSYSERFTEVAAATNAQGLSLSLRPQTESELSDVGQGLAVDLILNDTAFDAAFIVEAAPNDVVTRVLDDGIRSMLLRVRPGEVVTREGFIQVDKEDWIDDRDALTAVIQLAAALARRIPIAKDEASRSAATGGYRGDDDAARVAAEAREAELLRLEAVKRARADAERKKNLALVLLIVLLLIIALIVGVTTELSQIERGEPVNVLDE
jgi:hypothetical protein